MIPIPSALESHPTQAKLARFVAKILTKTGNPFKVRHV